MRKIQKVVKTEIVISSDEEYTMLRDLLDTRKPEDGEQGAFLKTGTALQVTQVCGDREHLEKGQIVLVRYDGFADDENDYQIWYINNDGGLSCGWVKATHSKVWHPSAKKPDAKRGRRLKLDETTDG